LAEAGRTDEATAELQRAADDLDGCGAVRYRDATERELRKLGKVVHRRTRKAASASEALSELSERELEVARLVVDRKTNKEIAGELFVSLKTVEAHMRNLFRSWASPRGSRSPARSSAPSGIRVLLNSGLRIPDGDDEIRLLPGSKLLAVA
jgi:DNA-binding CsgD family transcriptional regulator